MTTPVDTDKKTSCIVGERTIPVGDTITAYPQFNMQLYDDCRSNADNQKAHPSDLVEWCGIQIASLNDSLKETYTCRDSGMLINNTPPGMPYDPNLTKTTTLPATGKSYNIVVNSMTNYYDPEHDKLKTTDKVKYNDLIRAQVKYLPTELQTSLLSAIDDIQSGDVTKARDLSMRLYKSPTESCSNLSQRVGISADSYVMPNSINFNTKCAQDCKYVTSDNSTKIIRNGASHTLYKQQQSDNCENMMIQIQCNNSKLEYNDNYAGKPVPYTNQPIYTTCSASLKPLNSSNNKSDDKSDNNSTMIIIGVIISLLLCLSVSFGIYFMTHRGESPDNYSDAE